MVPPVRMAYWLLPKEPELTRYRSVVSELGREFNGPKFEPHATIFHGPYDFNDPLEGILEALRKFKALELTVKELRFGEKFTQSCFIEFEKSDQLLEMRQVILGLIATDENPNDFPHMSLYYGVLTDEQKRNISQGIELPKSIVFDAACIVANRARVTTREDVEYWHMKGSCKLMSEITGAVDFGASTAKRAPV